VRAAAAPLSVIVQVTKRCDFSCGFCSETLQMADPPLDQLDIIRANLAGVQRVLLSGGEPLLRRDLPEIVDMYSGSVSSASPIPVSPVSSARDPVLMPAVAVWHDR
jgi:molybdenum cofactor biosynthesis enzyme MoaA